MTFHVSAVRRDYDSAVQRVDYTRSVAARLDAMHVQSVATDKALLDLYSALVLMGVAELTLEIVEFDDRIDAELSALMEGYGYPRTWKDAAREVAYEIRLRGYDFPRTVLPS